MPIPSQGSNRFQIKAAPRVAPDRSRTVRHLTADCALVLAGFPCHPARRITLKSYHAGVLSRPIPGCLSTRDLRCKRGIWETQGTRRRPPSIPEGSLPHAAAEPYTRPSIENACAPIDNFYETSKLAPREPAAFAAAIRATKKAPASREPFQWTLAISRRVKRVARRLG
jgi:hypothetical protein